MNDNQGRCPACDRKKSMRTVTQHNGRDWTGAECKRCGFFIPDVQTKRYPLKCADCSEALPGTVSLPYRWHEWEESKVQEVQARIVAAKDLLLQLEASVEAAKEDPGVVAQNAAIARELKAAINQFEVTPIPTSWQKRHETQLSGYYCPDCHSKRRTAGKEFDEDTFVRHVTKCLDCGDQMNFLDMPEDWTPDEHATCIAGNGAHCSDCAIKEAAILANKLTLEAAVKNVAEAEAKAVGLP